MGVMITQHVRILTGHFSVLATRGILATDLIARILMNARSEPIIAMKMQHVLIQMAPSFVLVTQGTPVTV